MRSARAVIALGLTLGLTLLLVGPGPAAAMSPKPETPCGADLHQDLLGRTWTDDMLADRDGPLRVLHPDSMATMDHRPERLNVHLDDDGRITMLRCG